ncbi:hypothetical protein BC831DRAFT_552894 [Entophlyctis helioformis]|nr:hypothetical protein BC831DRAFT_552894 [Entophlyctis helioformis]
MTRVLNRALSISTRDAQHTQHAQHAMATADWHHLTVCVADADSLIGRAVVAELAQGRLRSSFKSITALSCTSPLAAMAPGELPPSQPPSPSPYAHAYTHAYTHPHSHAHAFAPSPSTHDSFIAPTSAPPPLPLPLQPDSFSLDPASTLDNVHRVALADHADPHALAHLLAAHDCVCIVPSSIADRLTTTLAIIDACTAAGLNNVVLVSAAHPEWVSASASPRLFEFRQIEHALKASGIAGHCILRPTFLQQYFSYWVRDVVRKGVLAMSIHNGMLAPVHVSDVAKTVAAMVGSRSVHGPHMCPSYRSTVHMLSGPHAMTGHDMADVFAAAIASSAASANTPAIAPQTGKPTMTSTMTTMTAGITFASNSRNEMRRLLEKSGAPPADVDLILEMMDAARRDAPAALATLALASSYVDTASSVTVPAALPDDPMDSTTSSDHVAAAASTSHRHHVRTHSRTHNNNANNNHNAFGYHPYRSAPASPALPLAVTTAAAAHNTDPGAVSMQWTLSASPTTHMMLYPPLPSAPPSPSMHMPVSAELPAFTLTSAPSSSSVGVGVGGSGGSGGFNGGVGGCVGGVSNMHATATDTMAAAATGSGSDAAAAGIGLCAAGAPCTLTPGAVTPVLAPQSLYSAGCGSGSGGMAGTNAAVVAKSSVLVSGAVRRFTGTEPLALGVYLREALSAVMSD